MIRKIIVRELLKDMKKNYSLGDDIICMNIEGKEYGRDELVYRYRKIYG
jgi:hypothetical protein